MEAKVFKTKLFEHMNSLKNSLNNIFRGACQTQGLTVLQFLLLMKIKEGKAGCVQNIVNAMEMNQSNVSAMCKKLEQTGFLERRRNKSDERRLELTLTEKGEAALSTIDSYLKHTDHILEDYPQEKLDLIIDAFDEFAGLLEQLETELTGRNFINA